MKSRETLIRLRRFGVDEKRQKALDIESMIADFQGMIVDLERQIEVEQQRAGVSDINHYAYPTFAKAAVQRRDNLKASIKDLEVQYKAAQDELADAYEELKKVEMIEDRGVRRERQSQLSYEQAELDEFAVSAGRRALT